MDVAVRVKQGNKKLVLCRYHTSQYPQHGLTQHLAVSWKRGEEWKGIPKHSVQPYNVTYSVSFILRYTGIVQNAPTHF